MGSFSFALARSCVVRYFVVSAGAELHLTTPPPSTLRESAGAGACMPAHCPLSSTNAISCCPQEDSEVESRGIAAPTVSSKAQIRRGNHTPPLLLRSFRGITRALTVEGWGDKQRGGKKPPPFSLYYHLSSRLSLHSPSQTDPPSRTLLSIDSADSPQPLATMVEAAEDAPAATIIFPNKNVEEIVVIAETNTKVTYFAETEPKVSRVKLHEYFPSLAMVARTKVPCGRRVISVVIPLYNEEGCVLQRTIASLQAQKLPSNCELHVVVITDGMNKMDGSMKDYIRNVFKLSELSGAMFPDGMNVAIVDAAPVLQPHGTGSIVSISLVLKKDNHGKANSQMWWIGAHVPTCSSELAFGTDCGIVFDDNMMSRLINRLDSNELLSAVTGFQHIMSSKMQGDGKRELFTDPKGCCIRKLMGFDFEGSQIQQQPFDSIGFLQCIPGPCGLYRSDRLGTLKEGMAEEYFSLIESETKDLVFGNVKLAEDRIPSTLLVFQQNTDAMDGATDMDITRSSSPTEDTSDNTIGSAGKSSMEGRKYYTGFEHDAVFYFEAEKPLSQLVKQRRRWLNGSLAAYLWVLKSSYMWRSNHKLYFKLFSVGYILLNIIQGAIVRLVGPAIMAVLTYTTINIIPTLATGTVQELEDILVNGVECHGGKCHTTAAGITSVTVTLIFALFHPVFLFAHTPRAVPVKDESGRSTGTWRSDKSSAFCPTLFTICITLTTAQTILVLGTFIVFLARLGWDKTPVAVRIIGLVSASPYAMALLDGFTGRDKRRWFESFWILIDASPVYILGSVFFHIWLPSYATARISDLSWGNRDSSSTQDTNSAEIALRRAKTGRIVTFVLVASNLIATAGLIAITQSFRYTLMFISVPLVGTTGLLYVVALIDNLIRQLRRAKSILYLTLSNKREETQG